MKFNFRERKHEFAQIERIQGLLTEVRQYIKSRKYKKCESLNAPSF